MLKIPITAIVLAGGKSTRMNKNDKGLLLLKGEPLYCHVIKKIESQVDSIIINSNQNIEQYKQPGYKVIGDDISGFLGPLAGIYSGLLHSQTDWNLIVSCDTPFLPNNLVERLFLNIQSHDAAYVFDGEKKHPTIALIHRKLANSIKNYLNSGDRKLLVYFQSINSVSVDFSDKKENFININTPEELNYWNTLIGK